MDCGINRAIAMLRSGCSFNETSASTGIPVKELIEIWNKSK